jgi:glucosamine-6-phosphate deaminase
MQMEVKVLANSEELGNEAALYSAQILKDIIQQKGKARIVLSTGASQFDFFKSFVQLDIDWSKVEMFHLDEYVNLPVSHPASFRKYLKERFLSHVNIQRAFFVGEGNVQDNIQKLTEEIGKKPIDLGLIGIGENAHIAFNDPPANFDTKEAYTVVGLDEDCKMQQVREGWFPTIGDVPSQAITMTVHQIMQSNVIVSCVPNKVKAKAIRMTLENEVTNKVPATILKTHSNFTLFLDKESASQTQLL